MEKEIKVMTEITQVKRSKREDIIHEVEIEVCSVVTVRDRLYCSYGRYGEKKCKHLYFEGTSTWCGLFAKWLKYDLRNISRCQECLDAEKTDE